MALARALPSGGETLKTPADRPGDAAEAPGVKARPLSGESTPTAGGPMRTPPAMPRRGVASLVLHSSAWANAAAAASTDDDGRLSGSVRKLCSLWRTDATDGLAVGVARVGEGSGESAEGASARGLDCRAARRATAPAAAAAMLLCSLRGDSGPGPPGARRYDSTSSTPVSSMVRFREWPGDMGDRGDAGGISGRTGGDGRLPPTLVPLLDGPAPAAAAANDN